MGSLFWRVALPFVVVFAGFPLLWLAVAAGELAFRDRRVPALGVLRGLRRAITNVDLKVRSLRLPCLVVPEFMRAAFVFAFMADGPMANAE